MRYLVINGQRILWTEVLKLRREQKKEARHAQLTLFELRQDTRPVTQKTASDRYANPLLFDD